MRNQNSGDYQNIPTNRSNGLLLREERDHDGDSTGHVDDAKEQIGTGECPVGQTPSDGTKLATDGGSIVEDGLPSSLTVEQGPFGPRLRCECGGHGITESTIEHASTCEYESTESAPRLVPDGGHEFYVVNEDQRSIVGGPYSSRVEAQAADAAGQPAHIVVSERALRLARQDGPIRDETGDVDVVTDGGSRTLTGPGSSKDQRPASPNPNSLTLFQQNILYVLAESDGADYGLGVKRSLEDLYGEDINHGRLYPNLDQLVDMRLVEKSELDKRTNEYALTEIGREVISEDAQRRASIAEEIDGGDRT